MDLSYWLYMNEAEGTDLVDTHTAKLNYVGKTLREKGYAGARVPSNVFTEACTAAGINTSSLGVADIKYIEDRWL